MAQFKDDEYYITLVTFQVEDRLFRVPRHTLEVQSPVFNDMFTFPPPPGVDVEGSSDEHPIVLPDLVTVEDFKRLLRVLLPTSYYGTRLSKGDHDGWISVLKLSRMWQMEELHRAALNRLKYSAVRKSAVEKLALALEYEIQHWIVPAVNELARRPQPISVEDTQILGLETASKVAAVRERLISESLCLTARGKDAIAPFITEIFNLSGDMEGFLFQQLCTN
ncbi:hypothetical protein EDC04DRAFT_3086367 [Pisolithus marmoratus]|nr:hypothetical protein EDC04DRAFT_3086367 [Pisolithus marmoratus]